MQILIAGGTGLIGTRLSEWLTQKGHTCRILTRGEETPETKGCFQWNPSKHEMPQEAIQWADAIINLAGANVGEKRWNKKFKAEILKSRVDATTTIVERLNLLEHHVQVLVNASGTGFYGYDRKGQLNEKDGSGFGYLAEVCREWEESAKRLKSEKCRLVITRFGTVLSSQGGALEPLMKTVKAYAGTGFGSGEQLMPWIHIDDLCSFIEICLTNKEAKDTYNVVAPSPVTNRGLVEAIGKALHRPIILPNVPAFALRMGLGEFADALSGSLPVYSERLHDTGFQHNYPEIEAAVRDVIQREV